MKIIPALRRQKWITGFEANLVYIVSTRPAETLSPKKKVQTEAGHGGACL